MERDESEDMQELLRGSVVCRVKERSDGHTVSEHVSTHRTLCSGYGGTFL